MKKRLLVIVAAAGLLVLGLGPAASAHVGLPADGTTDIGTEGPAQVGTPTGATGTGSAAGEETGGVEAPAMGTLGDTSHGPIVEDLLNLPALDVGVDADGRIVMDLPALKLVSPPEADPAPVAEPQPRPALPVTGVEAGDLAAMGLAALAIGGVLLRRLRVGMLA